MNEYNCAINNVREEKGWDLAISVGAARLSAFPNDSQTSEKSYGAMGVLIFFQKSPRFRRLDHLSEVCRSGPCPKLLLQGGTVLPLAKDWSGRTARVGDVLLS